MCGIVGVYNGRDEPVPRNLLEGMADTIAHRGPDGEGYFSESGVGVGHRRLAIIDLSRAALQPMANETGDLVLVFNGEIYNFQELRLELRSRGHTFQSDTDCEVVIHAYEEWGEACLDRFNGMFAFGLVDLRPGATDSGSPRLFLARDRYGIKPLYYAERGDTLVFASEIKALLKHPAVRAELSMEGLREYFTFQNILTDRTLFEGIHLLPAGCSLTVERGRPPRRRKYWDFRFHAEPVEATDAECAEEVHRLFARAVSRQLVSDVPVGAYLSGGMDSGSISCVAARHIPRIHTFTCGFDLSSAAGLELAFDERQVAEAMSYRFNTVHYEVILKAGDMEHVLPRLTWHLEDLRVGQSYPNFYVAELASKFVKVVLSGTGGDELFAGYPWRYFRETDASTPGAFYHRYYDTWQRLVQDGDQESFFRPETFAKMRHHEPREVFRSVFEDSTRSVSTVAEAVNESLYFEARTFLHGLFLVEDKISMAHSLEARVPFMDNDLVDFALRLPPSTKLRDLGHAPRVDEGEVGKFRKFEGDPRSDGKIVLREAMRKLIPDEIIERRKQGFSAPDASWFRGESIEYVNRSLLSPRARINEVLDPRHVEKILQEHTRGEVNHRLLIWSLINFETWLRTFLE